MPLGSAYEQDAIDALANTPVVKPTPEPKFSAWSAVPRGLAVAAGEIGATAADTWGAFKAMRDATPAQRKQMDRTGVPVEAFSSELGDTVRSYWKDYKPDPVTASTAEQLLFGFTRGASKVVVGGLAAGPVGIGLAGLEEGVTQADELRLQGVDVTTRAKAGMVQGVGLAAAALPAVGQTALGTAGLYAIGGPGGFVAQQAATRHILQSAGYDRQAEQFDPFDPVGLAVATLLPAGFAAYGLRQQKLARAVAGLPDLPPRAADVPPAELAAPAPFPSRPSAVADAVRAYPTEVVDAAHVALLSERRAAANPGAPDSLRAMDQHETALARAEDQIAAGEPVRVADVAPEIAAIPAASDAPTLAGAYRDGSKWSAVYRTVQRTDGSVALVRDFTDDSGTRVQHLRDDGTWADGEPPRTALQLGAGVEQKSGVESFPSAEAALRHAVEVEGATRPAPRVTAAIRALPVDTVSRRAETFGENNNITRQIYVSDMAPRDGLRVLSYPDGRRFVQTVEIAPEARGKGIGQALYVAALQDGPIEIRPQFRSADATRVYDALQRKGIAEVVQRDGREFLQLRVGAEGAPANFPAWADQITSAIRELQTRTDATTTPESTNPEAAAPARGAGDTPAAAGAADAGRGAGVEAAGLSDNQARDAAATATGKEPPARSQADAGAAAAGGVRQEAGAGVRAGLAAGNDPGQAGGLTGPSGADAAAVTERGLNIPLRYRLAEASDLTTSHTNDLAPNPAFPAELQPRDRARAASAEQISRIENNLQPALLGESVKASDGAPIVGPDAVVESGNARTIALRRAYEAGKADAYRAWLADNAERFGLTRADVEGMQNPVLVRERTGDVNRAEFARQANESATAGMSPTEQARSDAARITDLSGLVANEDGTINATQSADFIRMFVQQAVAPTERGQLLQADGRLSAAGMQRMRNAIFAKAYGDADLVAMLTESTDANVRNILAGMLRAAPEVAKLRDLIEAGARQDADIAGPLVEAVRLFSQLRSEGRTAQQFLAQGSMFGDGPAPGVVSMLQALQADSRAPRRIAEMINGMVDSVNALGDARQGGLFGDALAGADAVAGVAEKAVADSRLAMVAERFPDLQVQLDGMDAPMPMADFMAAAKAEAADMAADAPLMKTAVECFLLNGAG